MTKKCWEMLTIEVGEDDPENREDVQRALADGWEPFSYGRVLGDSYTGSKRTVVCFKRAKRSSS
jgi:hypothetical protein